MKHKENKLHYYSDDDYEVWDTLEDGTIHHWVYIKHYKQLLEVNEKEKRTLESMGRDQKRKKSNECKRGGPNMSLSTVTEGGESDAWLSDQHSLEDEVIAKVIEDDFVKTLPKNQSDIYLNVIATGKSNSEFARETNRRESSVRGTVKLIKEKFKKFFE